MFRPDDTSSVDLQGPDFFSFKPEHLGLVQGVPNLSYTRGRLRITFDADGRVTAYELRGQQTDICAALS